MSVPPPGTSSTDVATTALHLRGRDALPLLQRISSNDLLDLPSGGARPTLFCDFRGRLLHRVLVYLSRQRTVWLLRDDAPGAELARFLERHVFREEVTIEDHSVRLVVARADVSESAEHEGEPSRVAHGDDRFELGAALPRRDERARVLEGRPAHGHEITEAYNPFEVGLGDEVHLDKGCYTGQEALQRLITYHSVRRGLARVAGAGPAPTVPAPLEWDGERAGAVTTAAQDGPESWIGLAVIRSERIESGAVPALGGRSLLAAPIGLDAPRPLGRP